MKSVLELSGVDAAYRGVKALRGVSLSLNAGQFACLIGPSGCGKSTLLRCIAGFEPVAAGEIRIGVDVVSTKKVHLPPEKRRVGIVFQDFALFPHLKARENVAFGLHKLGRRAADAKANELLEKVALCDFAERYPHELSGGQQQRVALARALALEPDVLLLDEPFSSLDPYLSRHMLSELKDLLQKLNVTVVMVTHDQDEAFDVADVLGVMSQGVLEQWGDPQELYHRPVNRHVAEFLGVCAFLPVTGQGTKLQCELGEFFAPPDGSDISKRQLFLRPDDVLIDKHGTVSAVVDAMSFRGTHVQYRLRLPSGSLVHSVMPSREAAIPIGQHVYVRLELAHVCLL